MIVLVRDLVAVLVAYVLASALYGGLQWQGAAFAATVGGLYFAVGLLRGKRGKAGFAWLLLQALAIHALPLATLPVVYRAPGVLFRATDILFPATLQFPWVVSSATTVAGLLGRALWRFLAARRGDRYARAAVSSTGRRDVRHASYAIYALALLVVAAYVVWVLLRGARTPWRGPYLQ